MSVVVAVVAVLIAVLSSFPATSAGSPLDRALGDERSLLSFLPDVPASGRFVVDAPARVKGAVPRHRGVFWRTPEGNVYTRVAPYDEELVLREVGPVADRVRATVPHEKRTEDRRLLLPIATQPVDVGDEFQYSLERLVATLGLRAFTLPLDEPECRDALDRYGAAARRAVRGVEPRFVRSGATETWRIGLVALRAGLRPLHDAVGRGCGGGEADHSQPAAILVERSARRVSVRLAEIEGDDLPEEHVVRVTPAPAGAPPLEPRPVPAFDVLNDYLLAVNACRGRPWEYSNFMASDRYEPPEELTVGPTLFSEEWLCAAAVPPDRRTS